MQINIIAIKHALLNKNNELIQRDSSLSHSLCHILLVGGVFCLFTSQIGKTSAVRSLKLKENQQTVASTLGALRVAFTTTPCRLSSHAHAESFSVKAHAPFCMRSLFAQSFATFAGRIGLQL